MNKDINIYKELVNRKKILEEKGYEVIYIGLYGSQNYNLDDEESDIDVKAIIRTFDNPIPKKDIEKFPILEQYKGKDISYIVTESIEIL